MSEQNKYACTMALTYQERIALCSLAPERASHMTHAIMYEALRAIAPTPAENAKWTRDIAECGGEVGWDHPIVVAEKEITFSDTALKIFTEEWHKGDKGQGLTRGQSQLKKKLIDGGSSGDQSKPV